MYTDCVGVCARRVLTHLFKVAISVNGTELHNSGVHAVANAFSMRASSGAHAHPPGSSCIYQEGILNNSGLLYPAL